VAALQRAHGATGLTVATVHEAEVFAAGGFDDLLIAAPPIGGDRLERLLALARTTRVRVVVDGAEAVGMLDGACKRAGTAVGYLWEVDCGVGRFGTPPGEASADQIARALASADHCTFEGLLAFGGHAYAASDRTGVAAAAADEKRALTATAAALATRGIEVDVLSIGTTPTAHELASADGVTEIRPGNYVFYDATQVALGVVDDGRCALTVLATVVSRRADRVILDCGSKALAAEHISPLTSGFGRIKGHPELRIERLYEEQAICIGPAAALHVGDRVEVIPNHACTTVNLHERMLVVEHGEAVDAWPVDARGWSRLDREAQPRPEPVR
jgi:D-serine deaminase-like pyridoxal phosphate-dependent protein